MQLLGRCHCGNVSYDFETPLGLAGLPLRACQCTFCRGHAALSTADPAGSLRIAVQDPSELQRYRFGLGVTEFLICRRCGVYLLAMSEIDGSLYAVLNANSLERRTEITTQPQPMDYDGEDAAGRLARRKTRWTPVTAVEGLHGSPVPGAT